MPGKCLVLGWRMGVWSGRGRVSNAAVLLASTLHAAVHVHYWALLLTMLLGPNTNPNSVGDVPSAQ